MKISDIRPANALRPYVSRYWSWADERRLPTLLPGGGCELFFYYRQATDVIQSNGQRYTRLRSALLSPRSHRFSFDAHAPIDFISVRFRLGAVRFDHHPGLGHQSGDALFK